MLCHSWFYLPIVACIGVVAALAKLTLHELLMPLRRTWVFLVVIFLMNFLFFGEGTPWVAFGPIVPAPEGLAQGARVAANAALVLTWGAILTMTTPPTQLTTSLEFLLHPLSWVRVPVKTISLIISVAVQFVPTLLEETATIRKAQTARGAAFDSGSLLKRAQGIVPLVVPVFVAAFRRADELSQAMEARGYRTAV